MSHSAQGNASSPAAAADADRWLTNPGFLVTADPSRVAALLDGASSPRARLAAAVYRASAHLHRAATAEVRRQLLVTDAARFGDHDLAARIAALPPEKEAAPRWDVDWVTGSLVDHRLLHSLDGHHGKVNAVATTVLNGRPVAITAGARGSVLVWDLSARELVGRPLVGHRVRVCAVATVVLNGRPVAVTGGEEPTVRLWDLATHEQIGALTGHSRVVTGVVTTMHGGRPVALITSRNGSVRVWDLTTRTQIGEPLAGRADTVATAAVDGRVVALTGSGPAVQVRDLATREQIGDPLTGHDSSVSVVATTLLDGRPVAVSGGWDGTVRVCDLHTHQQVGGPLTGHFGVVSALTTTVLDGRAVAVTGGRDGTVRMWDLATREQIGDPLTGHTRELNAVATAMVDGRPVAVTGGEDGIVRIWDLAPGQSVGEPLTGHDRGVDGVAAVTVGGRPVVVAATSGWGATVRVFDLGSGRQLCKPLAGGADTWVGAVPAELDGRPVALTGNWKGVRMWDRATRKQLGPEFTDSVQGVATAVLDGRPVAVSSAECGRDSGNENVARVWDLASHEEVGEPLTGHTCMMRAVATAVLDGRPIALTASWDSVRMWDLATREQIGEPLTDRVAAMATGVVNGRQVVVTGGQPELGSGQGTVRVWDLATREQIGPEVAFPLPVESLAVAPGDRLVVGFGWEVAVLSASAQHPRSARKGAMKIRTGGPDDVADTLALLDSAVAWLVTLGRTGQWGNEGWSARPAAVERVNGYARDYLLRVAEDEDGRTVGVCVLAEIPNQYAPPVDQPELYVRLLVTDRTRTGSGIGAALIADARAEAATRGIGLLRVDCYAGDDRALVRQYESLGFTPTDAFEVPRPDDSPWPGQVLEIQVGPGL